MNGAEEPEPPEIPADELVDTLIERLDLVDADWPVAEKYHNGPDPFVVETEFPGTVGLAYYDASNVLGLGTRVRLNLPDLVEWERDVIAGIYDSCDRIDITSLEHWLQRLAEEEGTVVKVGLNENAAWVAEVEWDEPDLMHWEDSYGDGWWINFKLNDLQPGQLLRCWGASEQTKAERRQASCVDDFLRGGGAAFLARHRRCDEYIRARRAAQARRAA